MPGTRRGDARPRSGIASHTAMSSSSEYQRPSARRAASTIAAFEAKKLPDQHAPAHEQQQTVGAEPQEPDGDDRGPHQVETHPVLGAADEEAQPVAAGDQ